MLVDLRRGKYIIDSIDHRHSKIPASISIRDYPGVSSIFDISRAQCVRKNKTLPL